MPHGPLGFLSFRAGYPSLLTVYGGLGWLSVRFGGGRLNRKTRLVPGPLLTFYL